MYSRERSERERRIVYYTSLKMRKKGSRTLNLPRTSYKPKSRDYTSLLYFIYEVLFELT